MYIRNQDLREAKGRIPAWVISERLGIHENSFFRLLRSKLSPQRKAEIFEAIQQVKQEIEKR